MEPQIKYAAELSAADLAKGGSELTYIKRYKYRGEQREKVHIVREVTAIKHAIGSISGNLDTAVFGRNNSNSYKDWTSISPDTKVAIVYAGAE